MGNISYANPSYHALKKPDIHLLQEKIVDNPYEHYWLSDPMLYSSVYQSDKYLSNRIFREQYSYIVNSYTDNKIHKLLSIQPLVRAIVLSGIWNNQHALNFVNSKFYFNPYTLQLDTITTDQGPIFSIAQPYDFLNNLDGFYKEFLEQEISYKDFEYATNLINADKEVILDLYNSHRSYFPFDQPIDPLLIHSNLNKVTQFDMSTFLKLNNIKADISEDSSEISLRKTVKIIDMKSQNGETDPMKPLRDGR